MFLQTPYDLDQTSIRARSAASGEGLPVATLGGMQRKTVFTAQRAVKRNADLNTRLIPHTTPHRPTLFTMSVQCTQDLHHITRVQPFASLYEFKN